MGYAPARFTRDDDLEGQKTPGSLTNIDQIGVAPIPSRSGHPRCYSNIDSYGWAINRSAVTSTKFIDAAQKFISLVADRQFQVLAAEKLGRIPARRSALNSVTNKEVLKVYHNAFAAIIGGFLFAKIFSDIFWGDFWRSFLRSLAWIDLVVGFSRSISFGMLIATVSIYFGFKPRNNLGEMAQCTSQGALLSPVLCASLDLIVVTIYYL